RVAVVNKDRVQREDAQPRVAAVERAIETGQFVDQLIVATDADIDDLRVGRTDGEVAHETGEGARPIYAAIVRDVEAAGTGRVRTGGVVLQILYEIDAVRVRRINFDLGGRAECR